LLPNIEDEFYAFFRAEFEPLRRLGFLLTGNWAEAEELAQEAMVRTYRAWNKIRDREQPGSYARSILVNRRRSLLRRKVVEEKYRFGPAEPPQAQMLDEELLIWDAIRSLPRLQRVVLILRYFEDLPERELAMVLDVPVGTVKSRLHRGLDQLRKYFEAGLIGSDTREA
jgi:RNA polymerase sigma-70 factor (sigma-E family)